VNEAFERITGHRRAEVIGRTAFEIQLWLDPTERAHLTNLLRQQKRASSIEIRMRKKSGEIMICEVWAELIEIDGQPHMLSLANDVTERRRIESALDETFWRTAGATGEEFMRALVKEVALALQVKCCCVSEIIPDNRQRARTLAMCVHGTIVDNVEYELAGTPSANVIKKMFCYYPRGVRQLFPQDPLLAEMQAECYLGTLVFSADGVALGLLSVIDKKPMELGTLAKTLVSLYAARAGTELERIRSDNEIRRLNQELERRVVERTKDLTEANEELEAFAYSVSHDLRAPLRGISGFGNILLEENSGELNEDGKRLLRRMIAASRQMGRLIDDLLGLAKVSRRSISLREIDLGGIAREVVQALAQTSPQRRVETIIANDLRVRADPGLMRVLMDNLIGNAWKFTGKLSVARIEVGATNANGATTYFVRDNGVGFDMAYANRLFVAFERLHPATEFEGTGIGLATVARIIQRHEGRVWIDSEVGRGTTVHFTIGGEA
jgi:PAS domain S-box-containing protein